MSEEEKEQKVIEDIMDGTVADIKKQSTEISDKQKDLVTEVLEKYPQMADMIKSEVLRNHATSDIFYNFFGRKVSSSTLIMIVCTIIGVLIVGMILFQGFASYFRYHDQTIPMNEFWNWVWRKDPLNLPLEPLLYGLQAINFIFAGIEIGTNFITNRDNRKGEVTLMPKSQRLRILYLVYLWLGMSIVVTVGKIFLGTREVDYCEFHIYSGLATSLGLFASAERVAKAANKLSGNKDKIDEIKEFNEAKKE